MVIWSYREPPIFNKFLKVKMDCWLNRLRQPPPPCIQTPCSHVASIIPPVLTQNDAIVAAMSRQIRQWLYCGDGFNVKTSYFLMRRRSVLQRAVLPRLPHVFQTIIRGGSFYKTNLYRLKQSVGPPHYSPFARHSTLKECRDNRFIHWSAAGALLHYVGASVLKHLTGIMDLRYVNNWEPAGCVRHALAYTLQVV